MARPALTKFTISAQRDSDHPAASQSGLAILRLDFDGSMATSQLKLEWSAGRGTQLDLPALTVPAQAQPDELLASLCQQLEATGWSW